ncbi:MAG: hypothetical protein H0T70_08590 [Acidimicrobiia bacterium]|nr:hypothetical protein [Acidimicrobiia bacterium]
MTVIKGLSRRVVDVLLLRTSEREHLQPAKLTTPLPAAPTRVPIGAAKSMPACRRPQR